MLGEAKDGGNVYGEALKVLVKTAGVSDVPIVARDGGRVNGEALNVFVNTAGVRDGVVSWLTTMVREEAQLRARMY